MLNRDEDILKAAEDWQKAGHGVALATVVETWGSAPRPAGSSLVINDDGTFLGSVSGGCVEGAVVTEALDVISQRPAQDAGIRRRRRDRLERRAVLRRHHPRLRREGGVTVKLETLTELNAERAARRPVIVVTDTANGEQRLVKADGFCRRSAARASCQNNCAWARAARSRPAARSCSSMSTRRPQSSSSSARSISARRWRRWRARSTMT